MNKNALHILEFDKIKEKLAALATSAPGKALCEKLEPESSLAAVNRLQDETEAALGRIIQKGNISFGNAADIGASLRRLEIGSALGIHELLTITKVLENAGTVRAWAKRDRDTENDDCLTPVFASLDPLARETGEVRRCIISEDDIADDASPALRQIRRQIRSSGDRIHAELTRIVSGSAAAYLQDSLITTRDGRYCIPVKNEFRNMVPGIIHDTSSTGSTVFIEPAAVVRLNNEVRELEIKEAREIEAILARLSESYAAVSGVIRADNEALISLDFIFARARLALDENATRPLVNTDGIIDIRRARHPLIAKDRVVPIDVRLGEDFTLLVVTGPNTGGKTVSLKTVGLLTAMGLSGLHIPAADRSRIALFKEIYADIGDEQSIEQSLSTFSSHMKHVVRFLNRADRDSLVLFDELGAGTDPTEGAALAAAILDNLHRRGIRTMATTHYSEIKVYALRTEGVENASCEFNVETLSPTYRLLIGIPGKSNAFAISKKLGLPEDIIDDARSRIDSEQAGFEDVISDLEKQRGSLEKEKLGVEAEREELEKQKKSLEEREKKLEARRKRLDSDSSSEARKILQDAKDYADKTISWYAKHGGTSREMELKRDALRKKIDSLDRTGQADGSARKKGTLTPKDIHIGDAVRVISLGLKGTVNSLPDAKGNLFVTLGVMRTKVHLDDLEKVDEEAEEAKKAKRRASGGKIAMAKSMSVSPEINLLGKTVFEATQELEKYLDDASLAHLEQVRIVHGKGTGALRKGVQDYLKKNRHVESFRLGEYGEGDAGVTIAKLK